MNDEPGDLDPGPAGGSAGREYERRRAARELRVKDRLGRRVGSAVLALTDEPASTRSWARGSEGERELAKALADLTSVRLLNDRSVPGKRANIDHLVIGPAGVFVVDAKLYAGPIRIRDVGGLLKRDERLFVGRRDCSHLADAMAWQIEAVRRALEPIVPTAPLVPVLCFIRGDWPLFRPPRLFRGVHLEGTRSIRKLVVRDQLLDEATVDRIARGLALSLPAKS